VSIGIGELASGVAFIILPNAAFAVLIVILLGLAILATELRHPTKTLLRHLEVRALRVLGRPSPAGSTEEP